MDETTASTQEKRILAAEYLVELHSADLKKELRLGDLILTQLLYITGMIWFGTAGRLGSSHIMFWIPAALLFYVPSGIVVVYLNREMPLEGGIYQWAKLRFGDFAGFMVAWNLWASIVLNLSQTASIVTDNLAYGMGPAGARIGESRSIAITVGVVTIAGLMLVAIRGLALGRWIHNAGGLILIATIAGMAFFAIPRWFRGGAAIPPVAFSIPAFSLLNVNILGKMGFGAFSGFDGAAIFSGECRDPDVSRSIRRSVWFSGPLIALIYILGTAFVLVFTRPDQIDLIAPATQALLQGSRMLGIVAWVAPLAAVLGISQSLGYSSLNYNAVIRLPMVAGWDHLLPAWFSRLHPRYKTPVGSILFTGVMTLLILILGNLGVGAQEAFQNFNNGSAICFGLTYLVMFAIPLLSPAGRTPAGIRIASASGFLMTLLFVALSIFPIIDVKDRASFTMKVAGVVLLINFAGATLFLRANARRRMSVPV